MREWIVTFGGAGKAPLAPGTVGSLATAGLIFLGHYVWRISGAPPIAFHLFLILSIQLFFMVFALLNYFLGSPGR